MWYAKSSGTLSGDVITCKTSSAVNNLAIAVWGVNGANQTTVWDPNSNLPNQNSGFSSPLSCTMTTSNAYDILLAIAGNGGSASYTSRPSGFSPITSLTSGDETPDSNYKLASSTQSSVSETWTASSTNRWVTWCDAILAAPLFDPGLTFTITGTSLGSAGQTICAISPTAFDSVKSCTAYADYNTAVNFPANPTGQASNTRWQPSGSTSFTQTTGGNVDNVNYYKQLTNTYQATPNAQPTWDAGLTSQNAVGTSLGSAGQTICSITLTGGGGAQSCSSYADYNTAVVIGAATIGGAPANSQWLRNGACSFTQITGGNTNNCNYYKQWTETWQATANAQSTFDSGLSTTVLGAVLGVGSTTICTISPTSGQATGNCSGYIDNAQAATFSTTMSGAGANTQWKCATCTTASQSSGGNTVNINYYKQLLNTYQATPFAPSTWDASFETLSLDGSAECGATTAHTCSMTITTSDSYDVIYVMTYDTGVAVTIDAPTSSSPGVSGCTLLGSQVHLAASNFNMQDGYCTATTPGSLTIACNASASSDILCIAIGMNGGWSGTGSPSFDSNSASVLACPRGVNSGSPATCNYKSSNANDFMIACEGIQGNSQTDGQAAGSIAGTGATGIMVDSGEAGVQTGGCEYLVESSSINGAITFTHSGFQLWGIIADGLEAVPSTVTVTGTSLGSSGQTICTTGSPMIGSSVPIACSGFTDYNTAVTMGVLTVSANERWSPLTLTYTDTTGGNTHTDNYYEQLRNTYQASPFTPSTWDTSSGSVTASGTQLGSAATICVTGSPTSGGSIAISCTGYADYNTAVNMGVLTASANERWSPSTLTYTDTTGGNTHTDNYYEQLRNTYQATPLAQSTWDNGLAAQSVVGMLLGTSGQTICSITLPNGGGAQSCTGYADYNTAVVIGSATIGGAPVNSQWLRSGACSFTQSTGGNTNNCNYYKQYTNNFAYSVTDGGSPTAPTLTCTQLGSNVGCGTLATSSTAIWVDSGGSYSATNPTTGSSGTERWDSNSVSGSISSGGGSITIAYYHQYLQTISYSVSGGGSPSPPTASGVQYGSAYAPTLTSSPTGYWFDSIGSVTFTNPIPGGSNERWDSTISSIAATSSETTALTYYHQYQNTYSFTPAAPNTWDTSFTPLVTGTQLGVAGSTICTASLISGGGTTSCSSYSDSGSAASFPSSIADGSNKQWTASGTISFTDSSGGNTHTVNYYEQVQNTYAANPSAPTTFSGSINFMITGTYLGTPSSTICTITVPASPSAGSYSCTGYADYNTLVSMPVTSGSNPSNVRWEVLGTHTFTDSTGGNTRTSNYYEQLSNSYEITAKAQPTFDSGLTFALIGTYLGTSGSTICTMSPASNATDTCVAWADYSTAVSFPTNPTGAPSNTRWQASGTSSFTDTTGGNTRNVNYYKQTTNAYTFSPHTLASWDNNFSPLITGTLFGIPGSTICVASLPSGGGASSCSGYTDYNSAASFPLSIADGSNQQWTASGTITFTDSSGGNTHSVSYYEQLQNTYQVTANAQATFDSGLTFTITGTYLGSSGATICTITPSSSDSTKSCTAYADYDTAVSFPTNPSGEAPNSRWEASGTSSFTQSTGGNVDNVNYYKQWFNTFEATPANPATFDSGRTITFSGASLGVSGIAICSISPANGAGATSCSGWSDNGASVSFGTSTGGAANSQWVSAIGSTGAITSGGNTMNSNYYEELLNTFQVTPVTPATFTGSIDFVIKGKVLGVASSTVCTVSVPASPSPGPYSCSGYSDYDAAVSFPQFSGNNPPNLEWLASGTTSFTDTTGGNTHNVDYYEQLQNTYAASPVAPTTFDGSIVFTFTGTIAGTSGQTICTIAVPASPSAGPYSCTGYADYGTAVSAPRSRRRTRPTSDGRFRVRPPSLTPPEGTHIPRTTSSS